MLLGDGGPDQRVGPRQPRPQGDALADSELGQPGPQRLRGAYATAQGLPGRREPGPP